MRHLRFVLLSLVLLVLWPCGIIHAQIDTVKGEINLYTPVLGIDYCHSAVMVQSSRGFTAGDKVLLIQMKGATIQTANTSSFGDVISYNDAGNFELGTIAWVDGSSIFLQHKLVRSYTIAGLVQLIRVPVYANAFIDSTVSAKSWNGRVGGVVAMIVTDTLRMQSSSSTISATIAGFRGGDPSVSDTTLIGQMGYRYGASSHQGGRKGESIVGYDTAIERGRGHLASGGGGGNAYGAGGGGGGNYGSGGHGGNQYRAYGDSVNGGEGGTGLAYDTIYNKVFLGGGGGGGHMTHDGALRGGAGGGIIIVRAGTFIGNGGFFEASGDGLVPGYSTITESYQDGAGGGGGGGSVVLDINNWPTSTGYGILANGGSGYNSNSDSLACFGPGGGGAGGVVWVQDTVQLGLNTLRVVEVNAGASGEVMNSTGSCNGQPYGAGDGSPGMLLQGVHIPEGAEPR